MSQQERSSRMAVLLFTDMVDSVALERRLGTATYSGLLQLHHQLFLQVLECVKGGQIRNDTGDGILSEFDTAAGAVNAALLFQMLLRESRWEKEAPRVRIGIHQGQLAEIQLDPASPGKLVGMPVNIAARVMSLAQGGQILLTRPVYDDARQFVREHPVARADAATPPAIEWKAHGEYLFKGSDDSVEIFEVGAAGFAPLTAPPNTEKARGTVVLPQKAASNWWPAMGAALAALCGLLLWGTRLGTAWENASYDYLFLFATSAVPETNKVVLILMDERAYKELNQKRGEPWNRALHAKLLNQLADDRCKLVVFDINFESKGKSEVDAALAEVDAALAEAMQRQTNVVLMAEIDDVKVPGSLSDQVNLPHELFLNAATDWGIGNAGVDLLETPRRHWPFPSPTNYPSLAWAAARAAGAELNKTPEKRWLRYYGETKVWKTWSYHMVPTNIPGYFRDTIVFIGSDPVEIKNLRRQEEDKFRTPYTRWTKETVGGVQIMATTFLNLVNGDWLRRPARWVEALVLVVTGILLGGGLCLVRSWVAWGIAVGAALGVSLGGICLSCYTNYWFPWLMIAGGQVPCALAWALRHARIRRETQVPAKAPEPTATVVVSNLPDAPDYQLFDPPFGEGGFGKVWLARNAIGQWQALKAVYRSKFGEATGPYDAEFKGIQKYKPVSSKHPGLLGVDFVSKQKPEGYFYYVMELGDSRVPGWQENPALYKPRDLASVCAAAAGRRLPPATCVRIALSLADALDFLHRQGLTHRDIKPSNVIFVNEQPRLADVGLMTEIRPPSQIHTWAGTAGFMPPGAEEPPGTVQADIYALGMLLYVISTGREPALFPVLPTTLMQTGAQVDFMRLNAIIRKACHPDLAQRYATAAEMRDALQQVQKGFTHPSVE